jgi:2-polyprenyl-3-methyl-5-hydroxy-6-metoxy-1,4-benzoquinol methylase
MDTEKMNTYGRALLDFHNGDASVRIAIHRDDGVATPVPIAIFFRSEEQFSPLENTALDLCRGSVLDIGAGTGCHTLALRKRGLRVLPIDISPQSVEVMSARGIADARRIDVFELRGERFDTLLMLMHGIGMVETLPGLDRFLARARGLLAPGGRLVFDSLDVRRTADPRHLAYQEANRKAGRYFGEIRMQFEYKGEKGPLFGWLHVDAETLAERAGNAGWKCRVTHQQEDGNYLAQLDAG